MKPGQGCRWGRRCCCGGGRWCSITRAKRPRCQPDQQQGTPIALVVVRPSQHDAQACQDRTRDECCPVVMWRPHCSHVITATSLRLAERGRWLCSRGCMASRMGNPAGFTTRRSLFSWLSRCSEASCGLLLPLFVTRNTVVSGEQGHDGALRVFCHGPACFFQFSHFQFSQNLSQRWHRDQCCIAALPAGPATRSRWRCWQRADHRCAFSTAISAGSCAWQSLHPRRQAGQQ